MNTLKLLFLIIISGVLFTSCNRTESNYYDNTISIEEIVSEYNLWYIDYHKTTGTGEVPFLSKAFTISFLNGQIYANNNIVDIGRTGNGLGIRVGTYNARGEYLETIHNKEGRFNFEVYEISTNEIKIKDTYNNVTYYLVGYQKNTFDYDKLFYENIEYFLQEYIAWEIVSTSGGVTNTFDEENYLQFTSENNTTFYSSKDINGTNIDAIHWGFEGNYKIFDVTDRTDLKILTLNYDGGSTEEFELSVLNDNKISLYNVNSKTTYKIIGRRFIQYSKGGKQQVKTVRNDGRKRTKIKRETKNRNH